MCLRIFFSVLAVFVLNVLYSQKLTEKQHLVIKNTIKEQFGPIETGFTLNLGYTNFCVVNSDTLYNPYGFYYMFQLKNGKAQRLDHSLFHGGNFHRFLFEWKNKVHLLGGYGFFTSNNNLTYFNPVTKGWVFQPTSGDVPNTILGAAFKHKERIFSFNNYKCGNSTSKDVFDSNLYILNLKKMSWKKYQLLDTNLIGRGLNYVLKDFVFFKGHDNSILIQPSTLKYIFIKNEEIGFPYSHSIVFIDNNKVGIVPMDSIGKAKVKLIDLTQVWKRYSPKKFRYISPTIKKTYLTLERVLLMFLTVIIFLLIRMFLNEKRKNNLALTYSELHKKLLNHPSSLFTQEEFDVVFGIDTMEAESKKLKRHRIISDLNSSHPNFVERIKDESDKRRNLYKING